MTNTVYTNATVITCDRAGSASKLKSWLTWKSLVWCMIIAASMLDRSDRTVVLVDDSFDQAGKLGLTAPV